LGRPLARRRTLLTADLVSAAVLAAIPIAAWTGVLTVAMLLAAALAAGTSSMFFSLAFNAYLPHLLTSDDRLEGNARLQTSAQAAQVVGPGLGGLLAQLAGPVCGLLADALTFLVSAACLLSLRAGPEPRSAQASRPRMIRQIAEGLEPWRHGGFLLPILAVAATMNFGMMGVFALRIVFLVRTDGAVPGTAGVLISLGSLGGLLGAALARRAVTRFGSARTLYWDRAVHAACACHRPRLGAAAVPGGILCSAGWLGNGGRHNLHLPRKLHPAAPARPGHGGHRIRRLRHSAVRCGHRGRSRDCLRDTGRAMGASRAVRCDA
jgi:MFS family permease